MNCPHCEYPNSLEVMVDAYAVYSFEGFEPTGEPKEGTELRTDTFDDTKVMCAQCGNEIHPDDFDTPATQSLVTVTHEYTDEKGRCYDCGDPALFCLPDAYWNQSEKPDGLNIPADLTNTNLRCGQHAALAAAEEGERVVYLFMEDDDNPTDEQRAIMDHYPIKD